MKLQRYINSAVNDDYAGNYDILSDDGPVCLSQDVETLEAENAEAKGHIEWMDKENKRIKAQNAELEFLLRRVIGEHFVPEDCYATGPSTGDPIADLISCPSCSALDYLASRKAK